MPRLKRLLLSVLLFLCLLATAGCSIAEIFADEDDETAAYVQGRSPVEQSPNRCRTRINPASDKRYFLNLNLRIDGCSYVDCLDMLVFSIDGMTCSDHEIWTNRSRTIKLFDDSVSEGTHTIRFDFRYSGSGCSSRPDDQGSYEFTINVKQDSLVTVTDRIACGSPAMMRHTLSVQ